MSETTPPETKPARKPATPKAPTVHQAWSDVMGAVRVIEKSERNKAQGFSFRGIDTVVNAVGPQLREHRVVVIPSAEDITQTSYATSKGTQMVNTVVRMRYLIIGPDGSTLEGSAYGEASDAGDKSVSKAESVAWRMFLIQSLAIPTDEPDPDYETHQRNESAVDPAMVAWWNDLAARSGNLPDDQKKKAREWVKEHLPNKSADLTPDLIDTWNDLINDLLAEAHEAQAIPDPEPTPDTEEPY
jgi:hypothetical protein